MKRRLISLAAVFTLGFALSPLPASAGTPLGTPGSEGEVYLVKVGKPSEILPGAGPGDDRLIMALEILRPGAPPEWIEVPESEGVSPDAPHFVLFEEASNTLFLVWQTRIGSHPVIKLASFQDGAWAEVVPVSENVWNSKGHPQLAVTRDSFTVQEGEITRVVERSFLHVVWWEDTVDGIRLLYRPLILEGGRLKGMGDVYVLNDLIDPLDETKEGATSPPVVEPDRELLESPVLQPGRDSSSVLTTFIDAKTGRLVVAEIRLLPMGLGKLGEEIADDVVGYTPQDPTANPDSEIVSLASFVRGKILISGNRHHLNPRAVRELAQEVFDGIANGSLASSASEGKSPPKPAEELRSLADVVRGKILISGARIAGETLDRFNTTSAPSVLEIVTKDQDETIPSEQPPTPHLVRAQLVSSLPAPEPPPDGQLPTLFVSPDGSEVIVAWSEESALVYRKAVNGAWGEERRIGLSEDLALEEALELLRQSVRPSR